MVPSGEYFDCEEGSGDNTGCLIVICATALIVLGTMLVQKVKQSPTPYQKPKIEIKDDGDRYPVDTFDIESYKQNHVGQINKSNMIYQK